MNQEPAGPPAVGTTTFEALKLLGRLVQTTTVVTECEPDHRLVFRSTSGAIPVELWRMVEAVPGGTRFTYGLEGQLRGFFWLMGPVLTRTGRQRVETDVARLKEVLEASP